MPVGSTILVRMAIGALALLAAGVTTARSEATAQEPVRSEPIAAAGQARGARAAAQGDAVQQRLRQLEVFERLLTETVQRYVNAQVNAGIEEELGADGDGQPDGNRDPLVVKLGAASGAHGIYIDGYGVIFSIQRPQVSVLPRAFAIHLDEPLVARRGAEASGGVQRVNAGVLRFQSSLIQRQLREMETALERQIAAETDEAQIAAMRGDLGKLREQVAAVESRLATVIGQPSHPDPASHAADRTDRRFEFFGEMVDRQRSMREVLERNHARMREAVNDAATDTLANWGRVITGLEDDDRLSILVLPPTPWNLAQRHGVGVASQEYVISIRYRDVRAFDDGEIELDEFRRRARVHDRLGLEMSPGSLIPR